MPKELRQADLGQIGRGGIHPNPIQSNAMEIWEILEMGYRSSPKQQYSQ